MNALSALPTEKYLLPMTTPSRGETRVVEVHRTERTHQPKAHFTANVDSNYTMQRVLRVPFMALWKYLHLATDRSMARERH